MRKKVWGLYLFIGLLGCVAHVKTEDASDDTHEEVLYDEAAAHGGSTEEHDHAASSDNAPEEHHSDEVKASDEHDEHIATPVAPSATASVTTTPAAPAVVPQPTAGPAPVTTVVTVQPAAQPTAMPAVPAVVVSPAPATPAPATPGVTSVVTVTPAAPAATAPQQAPVVAAPVVVAQPVPVVTPPAAQPTPAATPAAVAPAPTADVAVTTQASKLMTESSKPVHADQSTSAESSEKEGGIDSVEVNDASGNWLLKRVWFEKSEDRYGKIKERVEEVESQKQSFFDQRDELETKILTPFYLAIGVDQGTLNVILEDLAQEFNQIKVKKVVLSEQEREFVELIGNEKKSLDQLKDDIALIEKVDIAVDEAVGILNRQIARCHQYEAEAWQYLQDITKELSDKKARVLYYKMDTSARNIANIFNYIKGPFEQYFNELMSLAKTNTERVKEIMATLRDKGIDFQKRAQTLKDIAAQRERGVEEKEEAKEIEEQEEEDAEQSEGWFASISNGAHAVWSSIKQMAYSVYETISGWFTSKKEEPVKKDESEPVKEAVVEEKIVEEKPSAAPVSVPEVSVKPEAPAVAEVTAPISEAPTKSEATPQITETPSPFQAPITIPAVSEPAAAPPVPAEVLPASAETTKEESPEVKTEEPAAVPTP